MLEKNRNRGLCLATLLALGIAIPGPLSHAREAAIDEKTLWERAEQTKTDPSLYRQYLAFFPEGEHAVTARDCVAWAEAEEKAQGDPWSDAFGSYLASFPNGQFKERALFLKGLRPKSWLPHPDRLVDNAVRDSLVAINRGLRNVTTGVGTYELRVGFLSGSLRVSGRELTPAGLCSITAHDPVFQEDKFTVYAVVSNGVYTLRTTEQEPSAILLEGARSAFWDGRSPWSSHGDQEAERYVQWQLRKGSWVLVLRPFFKSSAVHSVPATARLRSDGPSASRINQLALFKALLYGTPRTDLSTIYTLFDHSSYLDYLGVAIANFYSGLRPNFISDEGNGLFALSEAEWKATIEHLVTNRHLTQSWSYTRVLDPAASAKVAFAKLDHQYQLLEKQGILAGKPKEDSLRLVLAAYHLGVDAVIRAREVPAEARQFVDVVIGTYNDTVIQARAGNDLEEIYGLPKTMPDSSGFRAYTNGVNIINVLTGRASDDGPVGSRTLVVDRIERRVLEGTNMIIETTDGGKRILLVNPTFLASIDASSLRKEYLRLMEKQDADRIIIRGTQPACYFDRGDKFDGLRFFLTAATGRTYREPGDYGMVPMGQGAFKVRVPFAAPVRSPAKGVVNLVVLTPDGWTVEITRNDIRIVLAGLGEVAVKPGVELQAGDLVGVAGEFSKGENTEYYYLARVLMGVVVIDLFRAGNLPPALESIRKAFEDNFELDVAGYEFHSRSTTGEGVTR